jgi:GH15 family glucan-1,4-alpha-glucosidase
MTLALEEYALIGDRRSAALVSRRGSIDWLCWPRFDSDACFAALLGDERNGCWKIGPIDPAARSTRRYRPDTMILETRHATASGDVIVTDLMPVGKPHAAVIRQVHGERGEVEMELDFRLRFNYGAVSPWRVGAGRELTSVVGPDLVVLRSDVDLVCEAERVAARFTVRAGETVSFDLLYAVSYEPEPKAIDRDAAIAETEHYWRDWLRRFDKPTPWPDAVKRSLLVLQSLIFQPSGGMIAAPTLGLPEIPGGDANWDYRYSWLRDSSFALCAFLNAGFNEEAIAWRDWLLRALAGEPEHMRTMYRCDGGHQIGSREISWLPGYNGAQPIHVGNRAVNQIQLDIFGEVLDVMHVAEQAGIDEHRPWDIAVERAILDHVEKIWRKPDQGIWESRGGASQFTYSKAMAWVAADRFVKLSSRATSVSDADRARFGRLRDTIHATVCRDGYSPSRRSFVATFGGDELDASLLLLPLVGFLPIDDERIGQTIAAIERELVDDGLVRRHPARGDENDEGAFIACTCWLVDCLVMQGRDAEARAYLERVVSLCNDVGLLAEEYDTRGKRLTGNFPQALSHFALVNSALGLGGPVLKRGA